MNEFDRSVWLRQSRRCRIKSHDTFTVPVTPLVFIRVPASCSRSTSTQQAGYRAPLAARCFAKPGAKPPLASGVPRRHVYPLARQSSPYSPFVAVISVIEVTCRAVATKAAGRRWSITAPGDGRSGRQVIGGPELHTAESPTEIRTNHVFRHRLRMSSTSRSPFSTTRFVIRVMSLRGLSNRLAPRPARACEQYRDRVGSVDIRHRLDNVRYAEHANGQAGGRHEGRKYQTVAVVDRPVHPSGHQS